MSKYKYDGSFNPMFESNRRPSSARPERVSFTSRIPDSEIMNGVDVRTHHDIITRSTVVQFNKYFYSNKCIEAETKTVEIPVYKTWKVYVPVTLWDRFKQAVRYKLIDLYMFLLWVRRDTKWFGNEHEIPPTAFEVWIDESDWPHYNTKTYEYHRLGHTKTEKFVTKQYNVCPHLHLADTSRHLEFLAAPNAPARNAEVLKASRDLFRELLEKFNEDQLFKHAMMTRPDYVRVGWLIKQLERIVK